MANVQNRELTGAERYFEHRASTSQKYRTALEESRYRIGEVDQIRRAIEQRRIEEGLSKAELARRAGMRPEAVRRLLGSRSVNPTLSTVVSLGSVLGLEIVACRV